MDPDATLEQALQLARALLGDIELEPAVRMGEELAQHVIDLHEWLHKGGFLPARWTDQANGRVRG